MTSVCHQHRCRIGIALLAAALSGLAWSGEPTREEENAFRAAVARVAPSVVRIEPAGVSAAGLSSGSEATPDGNASTGLVVDAAGWTVATSFAVPRDVDAAILVLADGRRLAARVVGRDLTRSLVLLKSEPIPGAVAVEAAPRGGLEPGQWTIAVGRAWRATEPSVAVGVLSAVHRAWGRAVQTDASVSPLNYGGPLIDIAGRVIGILAPLPADTAGMMRGTELYDAGIGFAVPLEDVTRVLPRLQAGEVLEPGILGIGYESRDRINGEPLIASVRQGSPAARAGIRAGDRIAEIAGRPVTRIADVRHAIVPRYAGDRVDIVVHRRDATGAARDVAVEATLADALPPWRRAVIGIVAEQAADAGPLRVAWVLPGGPAAKAGIAAGDVIESIADTEGGQAPVIVDSAAALAGLLAGLAPGQTVEVKTLRQGRRAAAKVVTAPLPGDVPEDGPPAAAQQGEAPGGPLDAATVIRLEAADVADPPLAVLPRAGKTPVGVLVYFAIPHGPVTETEAAAWKAVAARHGIAVILPGSGDPRHWSRDDIPDVSRALASLQTRRQIDPTRIAVAGSGPGAAFAWLVAERMEGLVGGVALVDSGLPRQARIDPAEPGRSCWVLLGPGADGAGQARLAADRRRLEEAGLTVGTLPGAGAVTPADLLGRWVSLLGLL